MDEIWKDISGYEGLYLISNLGRIKSLNRDWIAGSGGLRNHPEIILKLNIHPKGYLRITLCKNKKQKYYYVHRLVLETFIGKSDLECNHKNSIKDDNRLENLEWVTSSENQRHAILNNLQFIPKGIQCSNSKLTEKQVRRIKFISQNYKVKWGYWSKLSKALDVHQGTISQILCNKTWRHI